MLIGVLSDTHDNLPSIKRAVEFFRRKSVEAIIHAGDLIAPFAARELLKAGIPISAIYGNNDGDRAGLAKLLPGICDGPRIESLGGIRILIVHALESMDTADMTDVEAVVSGHDHHPAVHKAAALLVNPGECGGWLTGRSTVALLQTNGLSADIVELT